MKSILFKVGLLLTLSFGLVVGKASAAEMDWAKKCLDMGKIQPKVNPDFQQINCLLTYAALSQNIPPEVVKAVAEKESSGWQQFDDNGNAVSDGKGFGIMQVTDTVDDPERVKSDIIYNIDQGVKILNSKYKLLESSSIPRIKDTGREVIENWYFPVMAYNGLKPVNSPIKRSDGSRNWMTYQDKVFNILEVQSFLGEDQKYNILAHYPFEYDDFIYDSNSSENIKFKTPMPEYVITDGIHKSIYMLEKGSFVKVIKEGALVRNEPTTSSTEKVAQPLNTTLIWDGEIKFTEPYTSQNVFTWFHVTSIDGKTSGYISSAYIVEPNYVEPFFSPTNVKASVNSYNSVKLSWTKADNVSGYEIYRSTSQTGTYTKIATTSSTSYTNTSLTTGTTYYYKIKSYKTGISKQYSDYSSIVSAKPVLSIPTSVKAASTSYNSLKTSWSAVSGANGYEVYRATSSTGTYSKVGTTTSTSFNNTGLTFNQSYYYKIRSYRMVGSTKVYGNYSSVVSAKPVLSTPTSVKAASSSYNVIKTSWAAVSGASGYEVYRATSSTGTYSKVGTTTSTSFNNTGLSTNKTYYYKIKSYRLVGSTKYYSNYSTVVSAKPIPSIPTNFNVTRVNSTSAKTTWSAVSGASGYEIYRSTSSTGTYSLVKTTTSLSYTNSGLTTGKTYYYKVRSYRTVGTTKVYSGWTTIKSVKI